jgi:hypothetical protein
VRQIVSTLPCFLLEDFRGVLVSDFYAADSLECEQQKCLARIAVTPASTSNTRLSPPPLIVTRAAGPAPRSL